MISVYVSMFVGGSVCLCGRKEMDCFHSSEEVAVFQPIGPFFFDVSVALLGWKRHKQSVSWMGGIC